MKLYKLKDVATITTGRTPSKTSDDYYIDGTIPFVKPPNLGHSHPVTETAEYINDQGSKFANIVPRNSIMVSCIGILGKVGIAGKDLATNQQINSLSFNERLVHYKYGYYCALNLGEQLRKTSNAAVVPIVNKSSFSNLEIPVPSLEEQVRIVEILDKAELLRQMRKESIKLLDDYAKSEFVYLFGDPVTNTKKWEVVILESLMTSMTSGSRGWSKFFSSEGDYFLTIKNVGRNNRLLLDNVTKIITPDNAEAKRTKVQESDILMSITADLGRTIVVPKLDRNGYINQHLVILRLKNGVDPVYISHFLSTDGGQRQMGSLNKGAAKAGLNFNDIKSIKILLPPVDVQAKYSKIVNKSELIRTQMCQQLAELENQFKALMQKAFSD